MVGWWLSQAEPSAPIHAGMRQPLQVAVVALSHRWTPSSPMFCRVRSTVYCAPHPFSYSAAHATSRLSFARLAGVHQAFAFV